jgi:zinc D-Ala-D-Ala carboxypeptidase
MLTKQSLKRNNFTPEEFFISSTADKMGIKNDIPKGLDQSVLPCLMSTADMMQELRDLLNYPIKINSAYRCKALNDAVGSKDTSQHLQGLACDFVCPKFGTPEEIVKFLCDNDFLVDQCFNEGSWVHISRKIVVKPNRMMYGFYLLNPKTGKREFKSI